MTAPVRVSPSLLAAGAGDAEVGDLDLPGGRDEHVAGLHVAVDDAVAGARTRARRRCRRRCPRSGREPRSASCVDHVAQRPAVDVLHDDERRAVLLAPVEDADDVGVVQARGGLRLAPEPLDERGVARELGGEHLERDGAVELRVAGEVHVGHAAVRDLADDLVAVREDGRRRGHGVGATLSVGPRPAWAQTRVPRTG